MQGSVDDGAVGKRAVSPAVPVCNEAALPTSTDGTTEPEDPLKVSQDIQLTKEMLAEEQRMNKKTLQDEHKLLREHEKKCAGMDEETQEQRYQRLKYILSRSNMYTSYLVRRMEAKALEEKQRQDQERRRQQQRENKAKEEQKEVSKVRTRRQHHAETEGNDDDVMSNESQGSGMVRPRTSRKRKAPSDDDSTEAPSKKSRIDQVTDTKDLGKEPEKQEGSESSDEYHSAEETSDGDKLTSNVESNTVHQIVESFAPLKEKPDLFTGGELRDYQIDGYNWLKVLYENGVNGILADEMGLGKTIQCIATIAYLADHGVTGPFIVVAPLSTVPNWVSEFQKFAPKVPVILYHGTKEERAELRKQINKLHEVKPGVFVMPMVVTSYEVAMNDRSHLQPFSWKYLIVDEGHRIKNSQCRLIKELKMYKSGHRLLLTGTPLQNNLAELWSLLNFLMPEIFDDYEGFESWVDLSRLDDAKSHQAIVAEEAKKNVLAMLHQILTPFMLRRLKSDVELKVPPKCELLVYAPLAPLQQKFYKAALEDTISALIKKDKKKDELVLPAGKRRRCTTKKVNYAVMSDERKEKRCRSKAAEEEDVMSWCENFVVKSQSGTAKSKNSKQSATTEVNLQLRNKMMLLRKICNHPYLIEYPLSSDGNYLINEQIVKTCGKLQLLDSMLPELLKRGHKMLIFSQMTSVLDILGDYCYMRGFKYSRLDGGMKVMDRKHQMDDFNKDEDVGIFLLSTRAGGLGINLVAADTVIIYDSDWNPQADLQAQDRCHRIGQTRPVVIYRLVTANTIDQRIVERAAKKRKLEKMVIIKGRFKKGIQNFKEEMQTLNPDDLLDLLGSNDYDEKVEAQGRGQKVISEQELNRLLDRSHLYQQWEAAKTAQNQGKQVQDVGETKEEGVGDLFKLMPTQDLTN